MSNTKLFTPCENFKAITPSDADTIKNGDDETVSTRFIQVAADGAVTCVNAEGEDVAITMIAGHLYPVVTNQIKATGTTATGIVALW